MKNLFIALLLFVVIVSLGCTKIEITGPESGEEAVESVTIEEAEEEGEEEITVQDEEPEEEADVKGMAEEVRELLEKAEENVEGISYKYKGPETDERFYTSYVKGDRIRYILDPAVKDIQLDDDAYESIFINKESDFAGGYCVDRKCTVFGKKATLNYDEVYIKTPFDWLEEIESAEKLGEQQIGKRSTWRLDTNFGIIWVDTHYGVPLKVESEGNEYEFMQMTVNDVKDSVVVPK